MGERAAQVVQQLPPCQRGQGIFLTPSPAVRHPGEQPRQQLPVPPDPAVQAGVVGTHLIGKSVCELHLPQQSGPEVGALQQVMGQYPPLRHPAVQTGIEGVHLEDALSRIGPLVKQVVVHVTGRAAIGVHSPQPGKHPGEQGAVGGGQLHRHSGLEQGVPLRDHPALPVHLRLIQGMEHCPHQLPGRAHVQAGIAVQSDDIAGVRQGPPVSGEYLQPAGAVLQQPHQLHQRAPLPFPAHPAPIPGTVTGFPEKEVEAAPVLPVQAVHLLPGLPDPAPPLRPHGGIPVGQIGQHPQPQLSAAVPVGQMVALQLFCQLTAALLSGQQGRDDAEGPPLRRDAGLQRHAVDRARGHQTDQKKVRAVFHQIGQGEKEQQPPHPAVQQQSQSGGEQGGREQDQRAVARPGPCPFLRPQRAAEEEPAHVALRPRPLPGQLQDPPGRLLLPHAALSRQTAHLSPVSPACGVLHGAITSRRVLAQDSLHPALRLQQRPPVPIGQGPQPGKDRLKGGGPCLLLLQRRQVPAQTTQLTQQRPGQGGDQQGQLPFGEGQYGLERGEKDRQAAAVQVGDRPKRRPGGTLENRLAVPAASQGPAPAEGPLRHPPLPRRQIGVVQQPLHRSRRAPALLGPAGQLLPGALHLGQRAPHLPGHSPRADRSLQLQCPGGVGPVSGQMGFIHGNMGGVRSRHGGSS